MIKKVKVSQLSEATTLEGLWILGVNAGNQSVKAAMKLLRGLDGKSIEMQKTETAIQFRQEGGVWKDLLLMTDIQKPAIDAAEDLQNKFNRIDETEQLRVQAEQQRVSSETIRIAAENNRETAEENRSEAEIIRSVNEDTREANETARINSETNRNTQELQRVANENTRISNETVRQQQETQRQAASAEAVENAEVATDRLNTLSDNRDKVINDTWWRYNEATGEYENTGIKAKGDVMYATFDINPTTGELEMTTPDLYNGPEFDLDQKGYLNVTINEE